MYNNTNYCSMAKIIAACKSEERGTKKKAVAEGILKEDYGLVGDGRMNVHPCLEDSHGWEIGTLNW